MNDQQEVVTALTRFRSAIEERDVRLGEHDARLTDVEQKLARRGGDGSPEASRDRGGSFAPAADQIVAGLRDTNSVRIGLAQSIRAALTGGSGGSVNVAPQRLDIVSDYHGPATRLISLLPSRPVTGNSFEFLRVRYAEDSGGTVIGKNAAEQVNEGDIKSESEFNAELINATVRTWAHWVAASEQILQDEVELRSVLDGLLREGLLDVVDAAAYTRMTTSGNYTAFSPTGAIVGDNIARIASDLANRGAQQIVVALNPADYLTAILAKASTAGTYLGLPPALGARVASVAAVASGKLLAFSTTGSGPNYGDRQGVTIEAGRKNDDFVKNLVTIRAECRGEIFVRDPAHVAYGNTTA